MTKGPPDWRAFAVSSSSLVKLGMYRRDRFIDEVRRPARIHLHRRLRNVPAVETPKDLLGRLPKIDAKVIDQLKLSCPCDLRI